MLHHLSTALFTLSDPVIGDVRIEVKHKTMTKGRPRIDIDPAFLEQALFLRSPTGIAKEVAVSSRTLRRRILELGLREPGQPVYTTHLDATGVQTRQYISNNTGPRLNSFTEPQLDDILTDALTRFPEFGRKLMTGY